MSTQAERNARLDALAEATKQWAKQRREYLKNQAALAKRVLKGRTGSERLKNTSVTLASELLVEELNTFLTG